MSGHSKWSTIKRKKGKLDAERGKLFTKLIREISIAARAGGGDPAGNPRLRPAINAARGANMPQANVAKAILKGTGELPGMTIEEFAYEGYGPGGVAVIVQTASDNRNRTTGEVRHLFSKYGGNLGESGCVSWIFEKRGIFELSGGGSTEEQILEIALEAGAEDVKATDDGFEILCDPAEFDTVKEALEAKQIPLDLAEVTLIPKNTVKLEGKQAQTMMKLMEALEENDDVQNVYANFDIPEEILQEA
jgi:YebC/PmpR family DNA-binding regulatory protein